MTKLAPKNKNSRVVFIVLNDVLQFQFVKDCIDSYRLQDSYKYVVLHGGDLVGKLKDEDHIIIDEFDAYFHDYAMCVVRTNKLAKQTTLTGVF